MRHAQPRLVDDLVAVDEQIEVDRSRPPRAPVAHPPELLLDAQERVQELARRQARLDGDGAVQELRLVGLPDRLGLAQL